MHSCTSGRSHYRAEILGIFNSIQQEKRGKLTALQNFIDKDFQIAAGSGSYDVRYHSLMHIIGVFGQAGYIERFDMNSLRIGESAHVADTFSPRLIGKLQLPDNTCPQSR